MGLVVCDLLVVDAPGVCALGLIMFVITIAWRGGSLSVWGWLWV